MSSRESSGSVSDRTLATFALVCVFVVLVLLLCAAKHREREPGDAAVAIELARLAAELRHELGSLKGAQLEAEELARQLEGARAKVKGASDRLAQVDSHNHLLDANLEIAEKSRKELEKRCEGERNQLERELADARKALLTARTEVSSLRPALEDAKQKRDQATATANELRAQNEVLAQERAAALAKWQSLLEEEHQIRQTLLGLKGREGRLDRVAILLDRSASMESHWQDACAIVELWLRYLPITKCVLIPFNEKPTLFPCDGCFLDVAADETGEARKKILCQVRSLKPSGMTDPLGALEKAYEYEDLNAVILLTDGRPTTGVLDALRVSHTLNKVSALCGGERNREIPVNTVGVGGYIKRSRSRFLHTVAGSTGGGFLGQ